MPSRVCATCARHLSRTGQPSSHFGSLSMSHPSSATSPRQSCWAQPLQGTRPQSARQQRPRAQRRLHTSTRVGEQTSLREPPLDEFYADLLRQPLPTGAVIRRQDLSVPLARPSTVAEEEDPDSPAARARIIFGSRLAGPARRRDEAEAAKAAGQGEYIGSTWIAPQPQQPDNCCMSGCVNCVWDAYQEELEDWVATRRAAMQKVEGKESAKVVSGRVVRDGGKSLTAEGEDSKRVEGLMDAVPVGIREFMRMERNLREKKEAVAAR